MIKVFVQKTMAQAVVDTPLTSGSKGLTVEFVFSEDWNGLEKTAVFETSSFYKETEQLTGETIEVPEDVMAWANETLYVGVYGTSQNGATVIPTVYADCGKIQKGANDSEGGRPLIPAQSDILQNQIDSLGDRVAWLEETGGGGGGDGILLDTTLTQPGKAADAKAVGDALEQKQDAGNYLTDHNTFVGGDNTSSAAFYEAFSARKPCFLLRSNAGGGMVMWVAHDCTSRVARFYNAAPDGTVQYATLEGSVFSYESAAGGSGNVFVGDANTTVAEFYEAYQAGKVCFMKRASGPSGTVTWVSYNCTQYFAFFYHVTNGGAVVYASLSEDGTWTINRAFSDVVKSVNGITPDPSGKVTLPIPTTLPNPHKLTFSGAVNAEYDGSEAVEVVIPKGGGGSSGGGGTSEWTKLGDVAVNDSYEFIPLSFAGGVVTLDTSAEGYEWVSSQSKVSCVVHPIDIKTKVDSVRGLLRVKDAAAGTFGFYNADGQAQTSAAYDPATYKITVQNVGSVVMQNVPTYGRYKLRMVSPCFNSHGLRLAYYCNGMGALGVDAMVNTYQSGGGILEIELMKIPGDNSYMYRSVNHELGKVYAGNRNGGVSAFDIVDAGAGKTYPKNGTVSFESAAMVFVNGTRFELWGANND